MMSLLSQSEAKRVLVEAFKRLPKRNRENLLFHLTAGTPICCGKVAWQWLTPEGAG